MPDISITRNSRISQLCKLFWCAIPTILSSALAAQTSGFITFDAPDATQGTYAGAFNQHNTITGYYLAGGTPHGFVRSGSGVLTEFDVPGSSYTSPTSIGPDDQIVGIFLRPGDTHDHAFLRTASGHFTSVDVPGAADTEPGMIDDSGEIIGIFDTSSSGVWHGFIRRANGVYQRFDDPDAGTGSSEGTFPSAINASGEIVGSSKKNVTYQGFIRDSSGNFTAVKAPGAGSVGTLLSAVNVAGETAGSYLDINLIRHGFLRDTAGNLTIIDDPAATNTSIGQLTDSGIIIGSISKGALSGSFERDQSGNFSPILVPIPNTGVFGGLTSSGAIVGYYLDLNSIPHGFIEQ